MRCWRMRRLSGSVVALVAAAVAVKAVIRRARPIPQGEFFFCMADLLGHLIIRFIYGEFKVE